MPIQSGDIKFRKSDTMDDVPDGGGAMTAAVIVDGLSNAIFPDVSSLKSIYGGVDLRKIFVGVDTQNDDRFFGARVILSKLPKNQKMSVNLFSTGDYFDRRTASASRVENYLGQGGAYNGWLWGTQYQGSRTLSMFQLESTPAPAVGDVLCLVMASQSLIQYVRVTKIETLVQQFSDSNGVFAKLTLSIQLSDALKADFTGYTPSRNDSYSGQGSVFRTIVANAARYFSARPLAVAANPTQLSLSVDSSYSQLVPSSKSEVALADIKASGDAVPIVLSSAASVSLSTSLVFSANTNFYLGSSCAPGSLLVDFSNGTLTDAGGNIKSGATTVGTIDYAAGVLRFSASSPTFSGAKTVKFWPGAAPIMVADTASIRVTAANRGYVWTLNLSPPPDPGAASVSYRALGHWYTLRDNAMGGLIAAEAGIGSGSVNYETGSVILTTSALPDAGTDILFTWGQGADFFSRANVAVQPSKYSFTLAHAGFVASTLVISWAGGNSATCTAGGIISGSGLSGKLDLITGVATFSSATLLAGGTTFSVAYSYGDELSETVTTINVHGDGYTVDFGLAHVNIVPGSLKLAWNAPYHYDDPRFFETVYSSTSQSDSDDGVGGLKRGRGAVIDYINGSVTFNSQSPVAMKYPIVGQAPTRASQ